MVNCRCLNCCYFVRYLGKRDIAGGEVYEIQCQNFPKPIHMNKCGNYQDCPGYKNATIRIENLAW